MRKVITLLLMVLSIGTTSALAVPATRANCLKSLKKATDSANTAGMKPVLDRVVNNVRAECDRLDELNDLVDNLEFSTDPRKEQKMQSTKDIIAMKVDHINSLFGVLVKEFSANLVDEDYLK